MADLTAIRTVLATQINEHTGLRAMAQVKDQVSPPVALVLPGTPLITYGITMAGLPNNGAVTINLAILLLISDAAPTEMVQRALDTFLGIGAGEGQSIAGAIEMDPSLGGVVEWCTPVSVTTYGRIEYASENYFGAKLNTNVGVF